MLFLLFVYSSHSPGYGLSPCRPSPFLTPPLPSPSPCILRLLSGTAFHGIGGFRGERGRRCGWQTLTGLRRVERKRKREISPLRDVSVSSGEVRLGLLFFFGSAPVTCQITVFVTQCIMLGLVCLGDGEGEHGSGNISSVLYLYLEG